MNGRFGSRNLLKRLPTVAGLIAAPVNLAVPAADADRAVWRAAVDHPNATPVPRSRKKLAQPQPVRQSANFSIWINGRHDGFSIGQKFVVQKKFVPMGYSDAFGFDDGCL